MALLLRIVIGGRLVGAQRWSIGHSAMIDGIGGGDPLNAYAESIFSAFKTTWWSPTATGNLKNLNTPATNVDSVRVYVKANSSAPAVSIGTSNGAAAAGVVTGSGTPPQCALVATLEDGQAGRQHKGRMYLPATSALVDNATLLLSSSYAQGVATLAANYLSAFRAISAPGGSVVTPVVSSATAGFPLQRVSVDTVFDTQRRRRDKLVGQRFGASLVVG